MIVNFVDAEGTLTDLGAALYGWICFKRRWLDAGPSELCSRVEDREALRAEYEEASHWMKTAGYRLGWLLELPARWGESEC